MTTFLHRRALVAAATMIVLSAPALAQPGSSTEPASALPRGYYRTPALANDTLIFAAEGDLWTVALTGGKASRLTSHPGEERNPVISPDGTTVAFVGQYEGPFEVFTMPIGGGLPVRRTFNGGRSTPVAWRPQNRTLGETPTLIIATQRYSTLPNTQLVLLDLASAAIMLLPLAQASDAAFDPSGTLFFTRLDFQGSHTRRYAGGTAQNLWRLDAGLTGAFPDRAEAVALTPDFDGTSASPMFFDGRLYFRTDRSGVMNIWSMQPDGKDLKQHTTHAPAGYEVRSPSLGTLGASRGKIAYQLGADVWILDLANGASAAVPITLETDLDQMREKWVDKPLEMVTSAHIAPDGQRVALTARGRVFVAPRKTGRLVEATRDDGVRWREARFMGDTDGKSLLALSDKSGEVELWTAAADGVGEPSQLTSDADVLRWEALPAPGGKHIAHHDKNQRLWIYDTQTRISKKIDENTIDSFFDLRWSPDGRWLAYAAWCSNLNSQLKLYDTQSGTLTELTSNRSASSSPAWHPKGEFLYFLSERNLQSVVGSPWGLMQPEPFFDKRTMVYAIALKPGLRSPFDEPDELHPAKKKDDEAKGEEAKGDEAKAGKSDEKAADKEKPPEPPKPINIDLAGIAERVYSVPVPAGNYGALTVNEKALFFMSAAAAVDAKPALTAFAIDEDALKKREWKVETIAPEIKGYELSQDGQSLMIQTEGAIAIIDAEPKKPEDLSKSNINLGGWKLSLRPREEWRQMYTEAWRLHRDYFYDRDMHGVDWKAVREKYAPLVERVACRADLSDVLAQMIAELSALHHFVVGGDLREGPEQVGIGALGAALSRDDNAKGWRIDRIYQHEIDLPETASPLARPGLDIKPGDVITMVNGRSALDAPDIGSLLRNTAGKQVLLHTRRAQDEPKAHVVIPLSIGGERDLRYTDWELSRRRMVEELGKGDIGYVHLQAMGNGDIAAFTRQFYPIFNRKGLIIDVRHNGGGNIDSWVLARLMRKAWFYWQGRIGEPTWNMQYAFRGHMCVLCNERTGSDGEAFSEGFRRLGLGKVIGTRTWGGEIWLSFSNYLVDKGIASAAETGVYGPEGTWLIEGRGVEPDIVVDNLPAATFRGEDAQLKAAVEHLQQRLREQPVEVPKAPKRPDKSR